jgi:site-specific DNA recombinase
VIATKRPHYGYRYNASRDGYEVDDETMAVVKRIFRMVGTEGVAIRGVKRIFEREGLPTPEGKKIWGQFFIREAIRDDAYRPHSWKEIERLVAKGQMTAEVASRLDPQKRYGIWWFNRRRTKTYQEAVSGPEGKRYKRRVKITPRPEEEWIAVPVPDSGVPREWVDLAREAIADNVKFSQNNNRPWELSGGIARCAECGWAMRAHTVGSGNSPKKNHYYACSRANINYAYSACSNRKSHRTDRLEPMVWEYVSGVMKDPEQLRDDLDRMIELKRQERRGDLGKEAKLWADKLAETETKRARYQEMAAENLITFEALRTRLVELEETRKTAERELASLRSHEEYVLGLERDRGMLCSTP